MNILIIFIVIFFIFFNRINNTELFTNFKASCKKLPRALNNALEKKNIKRVEDDSWDFYIPCSYTKCESNIKAFKNKFTNKKIFMIDGCDWIASKTALWKLIKKEFPKNAPLIMPKTFVLSSQKDRKDFKEFYLKKKLRYPNSKFILKNFKQRQLGLKLSDNFNKIINSIDDGFKLAQDFLENPFIINNRKVNLRYYLLIVCHKDKIKGYLYNDGFVYYTPKFYKKYSLDFDRNITTGYIDRSVYLENPLTVKEFRKYLGEYKAKKWDVEVYNKVNMVMQALSNKICSNDKLKNSIKFQIFGADLAPDENLNGTLMEINKGPDIGFKDEKDGNLKKNMVYDAFSVLEDKNEKHEFKRIY